MIADLVYASPGGRPLLADVFVPSAARSTPRPALLWIHGGGWQTGNRRLGPDLTRISTALDVVAVAVDYRLSGEAVFPAQVDDVKSAVRWVRREATRFGVDGTRIALWGASAGAHLAAIAALSSARLEDDADSEGNCGVQAAICAYPPVDLLRLDEDRDEAWARLDADARGRVTRLRAGDAESFESRLLGVPIVERPDLARAATPIAYVHRDAPPFLLLHGADDIAIPVRQSERLYEALAAEDNDVTLSVLDGLRHAFLDRPEFDLDLPRQAAIRRQRPASPVVMSHGVLAGISEFLRTRLANP
jgi:acetyl esterase/lipase